jgi:hypothetical protein
MKKLIIVLTHPRTGSSLLMQTLKCLNVGIIGEFKNDNMPIEANPKGYYEDEGILRKGIAREVIEKIESKEDEVVAIKLAFYGMIKGARDEQWQYLKEKRATILIAIRPPLETAVSFMAFNKNKNELIHFKHITSFLRNYRLHYKALSEILLSKVPGLLPSSFIVNYHMALKNPHKYVKSIIESAELTVSRYQFQNALENIDSELYRYNQNLFEENVKNWNRIIGADQIYNILSTQENPWKIISGSEDNGFQTDSSLLNNIP